MQSRGNDELRPRDKEEGQQCSYQDDKREWMAGMYGLGLEVH